MTAKTPYAGDRLKEVSTTTGAGPLVLPDVAPLGFNPFSYWYADGDKIPYLAETTSGKWQTGVGIYVAASNEISRSATGAQNIDGSDSLPIDFTGESVTISCTSSGSLATMAVLSHNTATNSDPSVTDDETFGYGSMSVWYNQFTGKVYLCLDCADGAAVWGQVLLSSGKLVQAATMTAGGTTGAQTINKPSGSVNFAAAASSLVVTNSVVTTTSIVIATVMTNDSTLKSVQCVAGSGSFTMYGNAAATAETKVAFLVVN